MRRNQLFTCCLALIMAAVATAGLAPVQAQQKAAGKPLITVLTPAIESKMVDREPLSPRLDTLEGKTIYLVDINWADRKPPTAYLKKSRPGSNRTFPAPNSHQEKIRLLQQR